MDDLWRLYAGDGDSLSCSHNQRPRMQSSYTAQDGLGKLITHTAHTGDGCKLLREICPVVMYALLVSSGLDKLNWSATTFGYRENISRVRRNRRCVV